MPTPYDIQLAQRQKEACELLATLPQASEMKWLPPAASMPERYRSKAKFAVGGSAEHPTLGITKPAPTYEGVDLPHFTLSPTTSRTGVANSNTSWSRREAMTH